MITIFSTPKNFTNEFTKIQKNAFLNWRSLSKKIEIIIMGNSLGAESEAKKIGAKYIKEIESSKDGIPTIPGLFKTAEKNSTNDILCYVNSDILFPKNFLETIKILKMYNRKYLAVGHRWDLNVNELIDFSNSDDSNNFWSYAKEKSKKHSCTGIDYFIFKKGTFNKIPKLVIGRIGWDNWLLWKARNKRIPLIDISDNVFTIHQNHSYNYKSYKNHADLLSSNDAIHNIKITGENALNLLDSNYHIVSSNIKRKKSKEFRMRNLGKLPIIFPEYSFFLIIYKKLYRRLMNLIKNF